MSDRVLNPFSAWLDWSQSLVDIWFGRPAPVLRRAASADASQLAALHAKSFAHPWTPITFEQMLAERGIHAHVASSPGSARVDGFIVTRAVTDEAEILSVAVAERARRGGLGRQLVELNLDELQRERINTVFLEVEAGNEAAIALYRRLGFDEIGRRKGYYRHKDGVRDALSMRLDLSKRPIRPPVLDV